MICKYFDYYIQLLFIFDLCLNCMKNIVILWCFFFDSLIDYFYVIIYMCEIFYGYIVFFFERLKVVNFERCLRI